ncbi:MAG: hypothetical protein WC969_15320 [Elusimicrobiota bacterium]|jgi:hypothetical protein
MSWSRIDNDIRFHYKVLQLGVMIGRPNLAHRYLIDLICWLSKTKPDGYISDLDPAVIASAALLDADMVPGEFVRALSDSGIVDPDGQLHDWDEYQGIRRERQERDTERKKAQRAQKRPKSDTGQRSFEVLPGNGGGNGVGRPQDVRTMSAGQASDVRSVSDENPQDVRTTSAGQNADTSGGEQKTGAANLVRRTSEGHPQDVPRTSEPYVTVRNEDLTPLPPTPAPTSATPPTRVAEGVGGQGYAPRAGPSARSTRGALALDGRPRTQLVAVPSGDVAAVWSLFAEVAAARGLAVLFTPHEGQVIREALERATAENLCKAVLGVAGDPYYRGRPLPALVQMLKPAHLAWNVQRNGDRGWVDPRPRSKPPPVVSPAPAPLPTSEGPRRPLSELLGGEGDNEFVRGFLRKPRGPEST